MSTIICIDAGHGGDFNGETHIFNGVPLLEKKINLEIALLIEEELRKYENVEVFQTRREDVEVGMNERTQYAIYHHADYLISIHVNSLNNNSLKDSMVLVPCTHYQPEKSRVPNIYEATNQMGLCIISKLLKYGFPIAKNSDHGLIRRNCDHDEINCITTMEASAIYFRQCGLQSKKEFLQLLLSMHI